MEQTTYQQIQQREWDLFAHRFQCWQQNPVWIHVLLVRRSLKEPDDVTYYVVFRPPFRANPALVSLATTPPMARTMRPLPATNVPL